MKFLDREKEKRELRAILEGEPDVVYFVYGPINSGKTALLTRIFEELPQNFSVFYINFRGKYVQSVEDLIKVLFRVKRDVVSEDIKEFVKDVLKGGAKVLEKLKGIPIPENIFELLFKRKDKVEDIFAFLENYFEEVREEGSQPVFVLDELQSIREVVNAAGRPVLSELFNFLVRMTKETHLCHSLCATSDCLFIEEIYTNARLEGRSDYFLVDDLDRERAYEVYEELGIEDKELVWDYVGGKFGDLKRLLNYKRRGYSEREAVEEMVRIERGRLVHLKMFKLEDMRFREKVWGLLGTFKKKEVLVREEMEEVLPEFVFWIRENVLFYDPVKGEVRPQGKIIWKAIKSLFRN